MSEMCVYSLESRYVRADLSAAAVLLDKKHNMVFLLGQQQHRKTEQSMQHNRLR